MRKLAFLCTVVSIASTQAQLPNPSGIAPALASTGGTAAGNIAAPAATAPAPAAIEPPVAATPGAPVAVDAAATVQPNAPMTKDFQGEDVATVLRILAQQAAINIIISDQIQGKINMRAENLTPLEAIKVIAEAKGLYLSQVNNVYFIKTAAEREKEPTESGNYTFSYAKANEALPLITTQIQSGVVPQIDVRTNTVYYRDFKSNMQNLALFFDSIDRPTQQVMIEARLVEVNANPKQSYGINWGGVLGNAAGGQTFKYAGSGALVDNGLSQYDPTAPATRNLIGTNGTVLSDFLLGGGRKNFASAVGGQFAILSAPQMSATLRLLNEDSDAEFLANPRVVTASNLEAKIKITRKQPIPKLNFNEQTASAVFSGFDDKEYGNTLAVTPVINKDNYVSMLVKPEISNRVSDQTFTFSGATVSSPVIDTRSLESNVLIKSGNTLAIGGLLQDESLKQRSKVPVLGDIPILGYVFQEHVNARTKRNLLVFVTPTIIRSGYGTGLEDQVSGLKHSGEEFADPNGWRNNARGAVRIVPTSNRQNVADYPKPGTAPAPIPASAPKKAAPKFKVTVPDREQ